MNPSKKAAWIVAIRPKTLPVSTGPVFLGLIILLKLTDYQWQWLADTLIFIAILFCAVGMQAASNIANDYIDGLKGHDDHRLGPTRALSSGLLSAPEMKKGLIILCSSILLTGTALSFLRGGWPLFILGLVCISLSYLYSGGPKPLSHIALGELFAFLFFGPVPVLGTLYIFNPMFFDFSLPTTKLALLLSFIPGLFSFSLMGLNNLRDRENDKANGKVTIPNLLPLSEARRFVILPLILSAAIPLITHYLFNIFHPMSALGYALVMLLVLRSVIANLWRLEIGPELNKVLPFIGKFSLLASALVAFLR
jgi:1,4-dihydroxy-2-naphthoate octaprenyltransferase